MNTVFSSADILLPDFPAGDKRFENWSVIACDQFTSEIDYWNKCKDLVGDGISAYKFILPEAYLGTVAEEPHKKTVSESMANASEILTKKLESSYVYVERTLPDGSCRRGIVGKIDLEKYDYTPDSVSAVRATEATVIERIPPRRAIREAATVELPHVLLLCDDSYLVDKAEEVANGGEVLYNHDLMLGGGHIKGVRIKGSDFDSVIADYENGKSGLIYAVGDGNHSLASAKAHYENVKQQLGEAAADHPARYALVELVSLTEKSLVFEPIYRVVKNCSPVTLLEAFRDYANNPDGFGKYQKFTVIFGSRSYEIYVPCPKHALSVGSLQMFLDEYLKTHEGECDYIHGEDSLEKLAREKDSIGFLFDGMAKEELFPYVEKFGTLPRKTFSMGEAKSKRYYTEARLIVK